MNATATILGISNFVSLPEGATENRLLLELPNGKRIEAAISDEDLAAVAGCFGAPQEPVAGPPQSPVAHPPTRSVSSVIPDGAEHFQRPDLFASTSVDGEPALVFGGVDTTRAGMDDAPPPAPAPVVHQAPQPRKAVLVGKDDAGNPIMRVPGAMMPSEVTGTTGDKDEDGVAQL